MRVGIVGCGTPGAYLAWKLSKEHDVTVFERKKEIGKDVCSGLVSNRLWDFIPKNEELIENSIRGVNAHFKKKTVSLKLKPEMFVLSHKLLDQYVAGLAKENGAEILTGTNVLEIKEGSGVVLKTNKEEYKFDRVIGCDGALSKVRDVIGAKQPRFVLGIQAFESEENHNNFADVWPSKNGFLWKIPRGEEIEYGIIEDMKIAKNVFNEFCKANEIDTKNILSTIIPAELVFPVAKKNIALCGDAAGFTKPWSKGGILWNLTGANILLECFPDFEEYNRKVKSFFGKKVFVSKILTSVGMSLANKSLIPSRLVMDSDWLF